MKDYTALFSKAIELKDRYEFMTVGKCINAHTDLQCSDWDNWADDRWYRLCPKTPCSYEKCNGFICICSKCLVIKIPNKKIHIYLLLF